MNTGTPVSCPHPPPGFNPSSSLVKGRVAGAIPGCGGVGLSGLRQPSTWISVKRRRRWRKKKKPEQPPVQVDEGEAVCLSKSQLSLEEGFRDGLPMVVGMVAHRVPTGASVSGLSSTTEAPVRRSIK
uniref:Uncharacterized protein n=1 Tax=Nelumbo nucifera TaxID=4432 RepID=A0A822XSV8_NELNU|nr:TPA_asm: hypothetical protein HUJ06_024256 [Nelumbo nucifera]